MLDPSSNLLLMENELQSQHPMEFDGLLRDFIALKPTRILEIGSMYGWTLRHWMHYAPKGSTVVSIDLPVRHIAGEHDFRVREQEYRQQVLWPQWAKQNDIKLYLIPTTSHEPLVLEAIKGIQPEYDFVFIDGDHRYEGIAQDFEMYGKLVKKGIVAFHDIAIKEEDSGGYRFWNQIRHHYLHHEYLYHPEQKQGIGVLFI